MKESEDNLENFFRNRAESNQYGFEEGDWVKMEAKLDAGLPVAAPFFYTILGWMLLGGVITALFFITYFQFYEFNNASKMKLDYKELREIKAEKQDSFAQFTEPLEITKSNSVRSNNAIVAGILKSKTEKTANLNSNNNVAEAQAKPSYSIAVTKKQTSKKIDSSLPYVATKPALEDAQFYQINVQEDDNESNRIIGAEPKKVSYKFSDFYVAPIAIYSPLTKPLKIDRQRFYTLSLLGSVNISSTDASPWGKPTFRFGIAGEYFVGKRWSIGIGANLSKKKYQAMGTEYSPPKGFWTNGVVPDNTTAVCDVLDVPLTVNYFQPLSKKSNLIMSGGLSSWFMLKEEYWYKYESNDPNLISWWEGENENSYWFSVVNIGVSYEHTLANAWSVAVGPYLNIPLTGVGHGNVALKSFGIKGALRFNKYKLKF